MRYLEHQGRSLEIFGDDVITMSPFCTIAVFTAHSASGCAIPSRYSNVLAATHLALDERKIAGPNLSGCSHTERAATPLPTGFSDRVYRNPILMVTGFV